MMWNIHSKYVANHPYLQPANHAWWYEEIGKFVRESKVKSYMDVNGIEERASKPLYRDITSVQPAGNMVLGTEGLIHAKCRGESLVLVNCSI